MLDGFLAGRQQVLQQQGLNLGGKVLERLEFRKDRESKRQKGDKGKQRCIGQSGGALHALIGDETRPNAEYEMLQSFKPLIEHAFSLRNGTVASPTGMRKDPGEAFRLSFLSFAYSRRMRLPSKREVSENETKADRCG